MSAENGTSPAPRQPADPPPSPEETALQQRKRLLELQRDLASLEKERRAAETPAVAAKPLEGATELDEKAGYLAELVAYQALRNCAAEVVTAINLLTLPEPCKILVVDGLSFVGADYQLIQTDLQLGAFEEALSAMEQGMAEAAPAGVEATGAVSASLVALSTVAGLMADLLSYFRSDYSLKGRELQLSGEALRALVTGKLRKGEVFLDNFSLSAGGTLIERLRNLYRRRFALERRGELLAARLPALELGAQQAAAAVDALKARLAATPEAEQAARDTLAASIRKATDLLTGRTEAVERVKAARADWAALSKAFDAFIAATVAPGEKEQPPPLLTALLREQVVRRGVTHILALQVVSGGGETVTSKSLFSWGRVAFLGGCAVAYTLLTADGAIVASDTRSALARLDYRLRTGEGTLSAIPGLP